MRGLGLQRPVDGSLYSVFNNLGHLLSALKLTSA
jgi:hypothetical protein